MGRRRYNPFSGTTHGPRVDFLSQRLTNEYGPRKDLHCKKNLLAMPDGKSYELVDGHLVERNMSALSSWVGGKTYRAVDDFVTEHELGWAWPADLGYVCFPGAPGKVRKPDVSFIRKERLPEGPTSDGFVYFAPDLAVEVISPNDLAYRKSIRRLSNTLMPGVLLVWVINPEARTVRVHRHTGSLGWLRDDDELSGEDVLPGFRCRVSKLFPERIAGTTAAAR